MAKTKYSEEQIIYCLKQVEAGVNAGELCRKMGISQVTFYEWKKKYAGLGVSDAKRLRNLEDENNRLKKLVADLTLDKHILQEVIQKKL
ncbi:MAG: transposase [Oligoflexus sp.]